MENETIFKIIGAIVAVIGAGKVINDITIADKSRLREDYKFAKEFLEEIDSNPNLHPLVVERGYHAIAGTKSLGSGEISYLLSLKNPGQCLYDYKLARKYLQTINTDDGNLRIEFAKKHDRPQCRKVKKGFYLCIYLFFALIAFSPLFLPSKYVLTIFITLPGFGYYAYLSLTSYIKIYRGEQLIDNQKSHTQRIFLPTKNIYSIK
jgi:hypothetical protein